MNQGFSPFDPPALTLFEAMPEAVWLSHPDGRIAFVSTKTVDLLGLSRHELLENGWMHVVHPDDMEAVVAKVRRTLETGEPFEAEARMRTRDGSYKWVRSRANALRQAGIIVAFVGHIVDIDKYRAAEILARNAESRLRRLIDSDLIGFVRLDTASTVLECNDSFARMLGYEREELASEQRRLLDLTPPEWQSESRRNVAAVMENGVCGPFSKEYYRKDGTRVPALIIGATDPDNPLQIISYVLDMSTESEYKRALQEARDFNDTLLDSMPIMFWVADADGKVTYFNRWFYEYTGLGVEQTLAGGFWDALHPDDTRIHQSRWELSHAVPVAEDNECRYRRASDGSYRWHLIHSEPIVNDKHEIVRWFGYSIDVHDQRRAAERHEFLLRATGELSTLLEPQQLFDRLVNECVPAMADSALLFIPEGETLQLTSLASVNRDRNALNRRLFELIALGDSPAVKRALETRTSVVMDAAEHERGRAGATGEPGEILNKLNTLSTIITPLYSQTEFLGVLITNNGPSGRVYDSQDMQTLRLLGERVSVIIGNAQRFAREHRVAEALQKASLPQSLPTPRGMTLHAFYAAAPSEAHIGGDWYDAVELDDGRVVLSIGDVTGRGLEAAVTMANIRQIIRGIAHVHPDPSLMLEAADRALRAEHPDTYVTTFACVLDPIEATLVYASAGHPPAFLRKADGRISPLHSPGLPLGLRAKSEPETVVVPIDTGDVLVLYTDGLTEAQRTPVEGERELVAALEDGVILRADDPARALYDQLVGGRARDDIAILTVAIGRLDAATASRTLRRWRADARDEQRIRAIRTDLLAEICFNPIDEDALFRAEMVFSELIGNVVRHTPGNVEVVLERRRARLVLHVIDQGEGFQFIPHLPLDAYSERGRGLFITAQLSDDFSVTRRPQGGSHARAVITHLA